MTDIIKVDIGAEEVTVKVPDTTVTVVYPGPQGPPGEDGAPGAPLNILGSLPLPGPPTDPGTAPGDAWLDPDGGIWIWDGTAWVFTGMEGDGGGATTLDELTDVATAGAVTGRVLGFNGSLWVPVEQATGGSTYQVFTDDATKHAAVGDRVAAPMAGQIGGVTAIGWEAGKTHTGGDSTFVGARTKAAQPYLTEVTLIGADATGSGNDATAVGKSTVAGGYGTAVGQGAIAGTNSVALGKGANAGQTGSVAIGASAVATAGNQIMLGTAAMAVEVPGTLTNKGQPVGASRLNDLVDVDTYSISPGAGDLLGFNGSLWVPVDAPTGGTGTPGPAGPAGPAGPTAVSTDAGNAAVLGTDSLIFVPVSSGGDGGGGTPGVVDGALTIKGAPLVAFDDAGAAALRIHMHDGAGVYPLWHQFHTYAQAGNIIVGWGNGTAPPGWQLSIPMTLSSASANDLVVTFGVLTQSRITYQVSGTWEQFVTKATPAGVTINDSLIVTEGSPALAERDARISALEAELADIRRIVGGS